METTRMVTHLEALAEMLWEERHITELLLYKLVCTKLVLSADEERYTGYAVSEVESVLTELRAAERRRDDVVQAVAVASGHSIDDLRLSLLVEWAPQPWASIFDDHRRSFLALTTEIEAVANDNRRLAASGLNRVQQAMLALSAGAAETGTYDPHGHRQAPASGPSLVDKVF